MSEPFWTPLGGQPVDYEGAWAAGTQYAPGDVVTYNGVTYLAVNPSLGSPPPIAVARPFIGVKAVRATTQSIPSATWTQLLFDAEAFDTDNLHQAGSGNLIVPVGLAGYWDVRCCMTLSSSGTGIRGLQILRNSIVNDVGSIARVSGLAQAGITNSLNVSTILFLADGDYVAAVFYQDSGSSRDIQIADTFFQMSRVA